MAVDDHPVVREGLRRILGRTADLTVVGEAASGGEALRVAHDLRPEVVVLDTSLPDAGPLDVVRQLRLLAPAPAVVLFAEAADAMLAARARAAGLAVVQDKCLKVEWARRSVRPGDTP